MKNVLGIVKLATTTIVGIGASKIVGKIIKAHAVPENLLEKVTMAGGAWAIGGLVAAAAKKHTDEVIDEISDIVVKQVDKIEESNKLARIIREESTFETEGLAEDDYMIDPKTKIWINRKSYAKRQLPKLNSENPPAGSAFMAEDFRAKGLIMLDEKNQWVMVPEKTDDTITLRKNAAGVWEEIPSRIKK